jgi:hypothetical protein
VSKHYGCKLPAKRKVVVDDGPFGAEHFRWPVCIGGHRWEHRIVEIPGLHLHRGKRSRVLVPNEPNSNLEWRPLESPDLFRQFAQCQTTDDGVRAFADRCGLLGVPVVLAEKSEVETTIYSDEGELAPDWTGRIAEMRAAVGIVDALGAGRLEDLHKWVMLPAEVSSESARGKHSPNATSKAWFFTAQDDQGRWNVALSLMYETWGDALDIDRVTAARQLLVQLTNRNLQKYCFPYLRARPLRVDSYTLRMAPKNLLGAMWWQMARLVTGEVTHRPCKVCGRLFEVSIGNDNPGHRTDMEYCQNACKLRAHRAKVKRAKELKATGQTVRQIARELDTEAKHVKNWLTKKK